MAGAPLVLRFGALGDMILTTPLLRALAARHGQPCRLACLGAWNAALLRHLPYVAAVQAIPSRGWPYWLSPSQHALVRFLAADPAAEAYLLEGDARSRAFVARAGIRLAGSLSDLATHDNLHQVEVHARISGFWQDGGFAPGFDPRPELVVTPAELDQARAWLTQRAIAPRPVLVHPGNKKTASWRTRSRNIKAWPLERWVTVIRGVRTQLPAHPVLLTGTRHERPMVEAIAQAVGDTQVRVVAGETPLRLLFALLRLAHSAISVDTGPAHAAGALRCPLVVLFGQTDPRANRPLGDPARIRVVTGPPGAPELPGEAGWRAHHTMEGIAADAVLEAWRSLPLA